MNEAEALKIMRGYYRNPDHDEAEEFRYTEALKLLIEKTGDPEYMYELGWYYCTKKRFDLEIKYLELAAEEGYVPAMEELGYMWYYGQHGEKDYGKAYEYFSKGAELDDGTGSLWCRYKLADMYRNGYHVEKDEDRYRKLIREAYEKVKKPGYLNEPYPEISFRMAEIWSEEDRIAEAVALLKKAKSFMAERLSREVFWGHFETMERIINLLYRLSLLNMSGLDLYDMYRITQKPCRISFKYDGERYDITVSDEGEGGLCFDGKWYRDFTELCGKAEIEGKKITSIYDELYDWEVSE